jgi:hypothetical protein
MLISAQINEQQENQEAMKAERARLENKLLLQERKLMEVPRMEEQYQRNARSIVRQQEVANTLKEIGWKKLEGEVKGLNFWKAKAKSLEETVSKQKTELDNLSNQGRLSLSRYQSLLLSYNTLKRSHPHDDLTMHNVLVSSHNAPTLQASQGSMRPSTASSVRIPAASAGTQLVLLLHYVLRWITSDLFSVSFVDIPVVPLFDLSPSLTSPFTHLCYSYIPSHGDLPVRRRLPVQKATDQRPAGSALHRHHPYPRLCSRL